MVAKCFQIDINKVSFGKKSCLTQFEYLVRYFNC